MKQEPDACHFSDRRMSREIQQEAHDFSRGMRPFSQREKVSLSEGEKRQTSKRKMKSLHTWAFYQLREFVAYKARVAGIDRTCLHQPNMPPMSPHW
ncbi:MAG: hypothetical protein ACXQT4_04350 [Methanotrichaceae archaeon]